MLFNTATFFAFFAVVFGAYHVLPRRGQNVLLLVASYVFYGWWDWRFCGLLALSTVVDFAVARRLHSTDDAKTRRLLAGVSIAINLGLLGFFKYFGFFTTSAAAALESVGLNANLPTLEIVLPVGISFYTFQTMAYTIDVYRRSMRATDDFVSFAVYVAYFPQLVAGPIERAQRLLPQLESARRVGASGLASGALLFLIGLVRKVVVADTVAPFVNRAFENPGAMTSGDVIAGAFLFGVQIYGDFAGYSDMARGVSRMLGIELVENFQHPYFAVNLTDFWRRWHVSLSQWLRDYLYIPLGGSRGSSLPTYRNLMLTMLLGGLWHGAAWTFVIWGGLHGVGLAVHKLLGAALGKTSRELADGARLLPARVLTWALTMVVVWVAWVFFRAGSLDHALAVLHRGAAMDGAPSPVSVRIVVFAIVVILTVDAPQFLQRSHCAVLRWPAPLRGLLYFIWFALVIGTWSRDASPFIYFQF